jgi:hypothetical protein
MPFIMGLSRNTPRHTLGLMVSTPKKTNSPPWHTVGSCDATVQNPCIANVTESIDVGSDMITGDDHGMESGSDFSGLVLSPWRKRRAME